MKKTISSIILCVMLVLSLCSNMLALAEANTLSLSSVSGDMHNVVLTFSEDMSGTTNVSDKIIIRNGANKINYTSTISGKTVKLTAKDTSFEADKTYILEIESGLGTDSTKTEEKYLRTFKNKSIFFEDFDNLDKLSTKFTQSDDEYKFTTIYGEGTNKGLYYNGSRAIYPKVENINTLENYSVSFDHKRFTNSNYDLSVMFFATATTDKAKPGYLVNLGKMQPGHDWYGYDSGTLSPAMELAGTVTTQGQWNTAPVINETNPENNYHLSFVKKGTTVEAYFGSKLVKSYNFSNQSSTGYFGFYGSENNINVIIDNLAITTFESAEPTELIFGGINVKDTKGTTSEDDDTKITTTEQLQAAQGIRGTAYVGNFSGSDKPVVIIVAMYGENNKMLDVKIVVNGAVTNGTSVDYPFEFEKNSNAVKIRCFALDSMSNLSPYVKAEQIPKE